MSRTRKPKTRPRTAVYAPGKARITQILTAALEILLEEGHAAVTLREVARRCKIHVGAITYYYKSREDLIRDLLESAVAPYYEVFDNLSHDPEISSAERLESLIRTNLRDLQMSKTTNFFPELWVMANRDPFAAKLVEDIYARQRVAFESVIAEINPDLGPRELKLVTLFVSSAQEGLTMFVGHKKPWSKSLPAVENIAVQGLVSLVKNIRNVDVHRSVGAVGSHLKVISETVAVPARASRPKNAS